jgi:hypothetical protein
MSNIITIRDINLGGKADSMYQGIKNSVSEIVGFDLHSEPGVLKVNQKLTKESGSTVDDFVKVILPCSDGNTYLFGSTNGKIWKRTSAGVYSLEATASPAAGGAGILDAKEQDGYIYYAMQSRLGRVAVGAPTDWTSRNDSWATFTNTDSEFHPMEEQNQVLYIGDKNYIAQVDAGVFSADALDFASSFRVKCLGTYLTDLLVGTFVNVYVAIARIFRWNTWDTDSYQSSDPIPAIGINSFLHSDNLVLVNCGRKGDLYYYNGAQLELYKKIPGDWSGSNEAQIHPNASCNCNGIPLFGLSNISGNPATEGIYSLGGHSASYPKVLAIENIISTGHSSSVEIGAIELVGTTLLVSWKDTTSGTVYGIDKLDTTAKVSSAYFETRVINIARNQSKSMSGYIGYRSLPTGTSIKIYYKANYASSYTEMTDTRVDTDRKIIEVNGRFPDASTLQLKIEAVSNANTAPEIDVVEFSFD